MKMRALIATSLLGLGSAFAAPFAYVPNELQQLAVIDLATNGVVARIPIGSGAIGVAVRSSGDRVYVSDALDDAVRVVNTATNSVVATIPVCSLPFVPALNPAGSRLVVPCANSDQAAVIDTASNTVITLVATGAQPANVVWSPSGSRFYVVNLNAGTISVFDGASLAAVQTITVPLGTFSIAFNPAGTRLYAASLQAGSEGTNALTVVDPGTGATVATVPLDAATSWIAFNPAGTRLYAANPDIGAVKVFDTANNAIVGTILTGAGTGPAVLNVSADGTRIYVELATTGDLAVHDTTTLARLATIDYAGSGGAYGTFVGPGSGANSAANTPGALSGQWWNHNESGWGIHFTQRGNNIFAAWYTYDGSGNPKWYVSTCATVTTSSCLGTLYQVTGPRFFGATFNPNAANAVAVGSLSVTFFGNSTGSMSYTVNGQSRTVAIERQVLQASGTAPAVNYTDLWWNPNESGWGMALTQQFATMFLAWYVYNDSGQPVWYVATISVTGSGNGGSGTLYRTTGPAFGPSFDPNAVQPFPVGSATLTFSDANNGTLSYTVNGVSGSKTITRQIF